MEWSIRNLRDNLAHLLRLLRHEDAVIPKPEHIGSGDQVIELGNDLIAVEASVEPNPKTVQF